MKFLELKDKKAYFIENYPFEHTPNLDDKRRCIHCGEIIRVGDFKVELQFSSFTGGQEEYIVCPNAPKCDGTVIDWVNDID